MSGGNEKVAFSLKAMLNKDESKLLFVEADSHFVDVVLSFLTMPLGKIVRLLHKHYGDDAPPVGSLTSLYKGLQSLGSVHFWKGRKKMLLNPRNSSEAECRRLKLNVDDEPTDYFRCRYIKCWANLIMYVWDRCPLCGRNDYVQLHLSELRSNAAGDDAAGAFTRNTASFVVFDDLRIVPNSSTFVEFVSGIGITEMEGAKLREVSFGFNEVMDLLKGSLLSANPLSDIILKDRRSPAAKLESQISVCPFVDEPVNIPKKLTLKVMVQKTTNKFLFAQAEEDLVDFLFSFLAIPLGGVACLMQGNTSLTNIDNLYKDVAHSIPDKYLRASYIKDRLIKPKLALHYLSSNQFFPLDEEIHPPLYCHYGADGKQYLSPEKSPANHIVRSFTSPTVHPNFVKGPAAYMITDDLVITQFTTASSFSILNDLNIPVSDVKQLDLLIGVPEGLRILKASLKSRSVLTDALLKAVKKEPKQEN